MKNLTKKVRLYLLSTLLSICTVSSSLPVFACEQNVSSSNDIVELTQPDEIKNAIKILGLTEEEAQKVTLYESRASGPEVLERGVTQMPTFSLFVYNRGNDRIFNGNKLKVGVVIKGDYRNMVHFRFCSYQDVLLYHSIYMEDNGTAVYESPWFDIRYGGTYYCTYECSGVGESTEVTTVFAVY